MIDGTLEQQRMRTATTRSQQREHPGGIENALEPHIEAATQALLACQQPDGHWVFELEADATIPAEYVLLRHYLGEPVDATLEAKIAVSEQRPAAMRALDAAQIDRDFLFEHGIDRLSQIMPQQHVFGRNGGVSFELEHPMAVGALARQQRIRRASNAPLQRVGGVERFTHFALVMTTLQ